MSNKRLCHYVSEVMALPTSKQRREALSRMSPHLQHQVKCEVERIWRTCHRRRESRQ